MKQTNHPAPGALVSELTDPDMLDLVEMFLMGMPAQVAAIEKALQTQDLSNLARLAHQLKGSAGGYGFPTITDAAKVVEQAAKAAKDLEKLQSEAQALADLCRLARATAAAT